ncbi:MAG: hypothetical protein AB7N54_01525 [Alphaproteobacteria bacterium]
MTRTLCTTVAAFVFAGLAAAPSALACTGSADDPIHCINNNQAITGFSDFFTSNLRSVPGNSKTSFVLTFSEPMDTATVEDNFIVRSFADDSLQADGPGVLFLFTNERPLPDDPDEAETGSSIWDKSSFDIDWNSDDTEATFTFTEQRNLPTDRDSANTPDYTVNYWNDASQPEGRDTAGTGDGQAYFKLTDGAFESVYRFTIATDGPAATTAGGIPRVVLDTGGGMAPAPAPFLAGETVATLNVLIQGEAAEVRIVRTEDGKHHALDALTAHDYGLVRPDRSGFGWNFDGTPVPRPSGGQVTTQQALGGAVDAFDSRTPFADGFESGDVSAWGAPPR